MLVDASKHLTHKTNERAEQIAPHLLAVRTGPACVASDIGKAIRILHMALIPKDYFRYDLSCIEKFNFFSLFKLFINSGNNLIYTFGVMISSKGFFSKLSMC